MSRLTLRRRSPLLAGLLGGVVLVMLSVFWVTFAPSAFGGTFSYVFTVGNSMEPVFHQGDLVFLRQADRYGVGEIIAFNDPLQGVIMHRVVEVKDGHYITRGDNRTSFDAYQSTPPEVIGHVIGHVPGVGRAMREIQTPRNMILLTVATLALGVGGAATRVSVRRVRWQRPNLAGLAVQDRLAKAMPKQWAAPIILGSPGGNALSNILALLLAFGVLVGFVVVLHGPQQVKPLMLIFEERSTLSYTAKGAPGIYDTPLATSGDPVFNALADEVFFTFDYKIQGGMPTALLSDVTGTARLDAELAAGNGWKRTFPIVAETKVEGEKTTLTGKLSIRDLRALIQQTEEATGVGFATYRVTISQIVQGSARVSGQGVAIAYSKPIVFSLDKFQMAVNAGEKLEQDQSGTVTTTISEPWVVNVPMVGISLTYEWMRFTSLVSVFVSIAGLLVMGIATRITERAGEAALIAARYADLLVPTDVESIDFGGQLVGVSQFEDLARMARRTQGSILHCKAAQGDQYLLVEPGVTYLYSVRRVLQRGHA